MGIAVALEGGAAPVFRPRTAAARSKLSRRQLEQAAVGGDPTPPDVTRGEVELPPRVQVMCCHCHVPEVRCRDSQRRMEAATCLQDEMDTATCPEDEMDTATCPENEMDTATCPEDDATCPEDDAEAAMCPEDDAEAATCPEKVRHGGVRRDLLRQRLQDRGGHAGAQPCMGRPSVRTRFPTTMWRSRSAAVLRCPQPYLCTIVRNISFCKLCRALASHSPDSATNGSKGQVSSTIISFLYL